VQAGALGGGQSQRDAGQHPVEHDVGQGGFQAQGDAPAGELLTDGVVGVPPMETMPTALTLRWISTGAPADSWVPDGRAGGGPAGRAP
jgi:hypothetical protein